MRVDAIAPYWLQTTSGDVTFIEAARNAGEAVINLARSDIDFVKMEIKMAFETVVEDEDIDSVILVTWIDTVHADNFRRELVRILITY